MSRTEVRCSPPALTGSWRMSRVMRDRRTGQHGRFEGRLVLRPEGPDRIRWSEAGSLTWGGRVSEATRTFFVVRRDDRWWVTFDDGRDFHPWSPGEPVEHLCVADRYQGLVETPAVEGPVKRWSVRWEVTGPAKDYILETELTRDRDAGGGDPP